MTSMKRKEHIEFLVNNVDPCLQVTEQNFPSAGGTHYYVTCDGPTASKIGMRLIEEGYALNSASRGRSVVIEILPTERKHRNEPPLFAPSSEKLRHMMDSATARFDREYLRRNGLQPTSQVTTVIDGHEITGDSEVLAKLNLSYELIKKLYHGTWPSSCPPGLMNDFNKIFGKTK